MTDFSIRLGTWNIMGRRDHTTGRRAATGDIVAVLRELGMEALCLQEVQFYDGVADPLLTAELSEVGLKHFVGAPLSPSHFDSTAGLGLVVASAYPLRHVATTMLRNPRLRANVRGQEWVLHDKGRLTCNVIGPWRRPIRLHTVHLFPFHEFDVPADDARVVEMWQEFWRGFDSEAPSGGIVAGDFNQEQREKPAKLYADQPWRFCLGDGRSTTPDGLALDDIAVNAGYTATDVRLVETFSDHCVVLADIQVRDQG